MKKILGIPVTLVFLVLGIIIPLIVIQSITISKISVLSKQVNGVDSKIGKIITDNIVSISHKVVPTPTVIIISATQSAKVKKLVPTPTK
jgi:hypothetical protein